MFLEVSTLLRWVGRARSYFGTITMSPQAHFIDVRTQGGSNSEKALALVVAMALIATSVTEAAIANLDFNDI